MRSRGKAVVAAAVAEVVVEGVTGGDVVHLAAEAVVVGVRLRAVLWEMLLARSRTLQGDVQGVEEGGWTGRALLRGVKKLLLLRDGVCSDKSIYNRQSDREVLW